MTAADRETENDMLGRLETLLKQARSLGAEAADAVLVSSQGLSQAVRLGKPENLEREESEEVGLRVLVGRCQAVVSSSDLSPRALAELAERAVAMARVVPENPWCGLAEPEQLARDWPNLDLEDPLEPTPEALQERAMACEEAARAIGGITNSEGSETSWGRTEVALVASNGFAGRYAVTGQGISVAVIAGSGDGMERDYDYDRAVYGSDLEAPEVIGRRAAERTLKRLKPQKAKTARLPVLFEPRVASSLMGHLVGAINGISVARGTSFLKNRLGEAVFAPGVTIREEPLRQRGHRSRPFDGEGLPTSERAWIEDGRLTGWILDLATGRQLEMPSTGNAGRGTSAPPSPGIANLSLLPGAQSPQEMIAAIQQGFLVTELMGMGVNGVTGDYSRGASGFWIEKGELAYPVSEITIAGNLKEMYSHLTPASDLTFRTGMDSPTLLVEGMTIAGR